MPRSRMLMTVLVLALVVSTVPVMAQSKSDAEVLELKQKVAELEKKVSALEIRINQTAKGGPAPNPLEGEAQMKYTEIMATLDKGDFMKAKTDMADFMKKYRTTNIAQRAARTNQELKVIGKETPTDWGIEKWIQGEKDVNMTNGDTTLVVFFEEWCGYCKTEVPKLQGLYESLKGQGLQIVGLTKITKSATEEKLAAFISSRGVGYPVAKENGTASAYFNVTGIPAAALVKDGKVIWRGHPGKLSEDMLKRWL